MNLLNEIWSSRKLPRRWNLYLKIWSTQKLSRKWNSYWKFCRLRNFREDEICIGNLVILEFTEKIKFVFKIWSTRKKPWICIYFAFQNLVISEIARKMKFLLKIWPSIRSKMIKNISLENKLKCCLFWRNFSHLEISFVMIEIFSKKIWSSRK